MARKIKICIQANCNNAQTTKEYCRLHYLQNWQKIKLEEKRKAAKRLNRYVEGIMKKGVEDTPKPARQESLFDPSPSEASDTFMDDIGYSDPDNLDDIISNLKLGR